MKCQRCGEVNPAEIHTCTPQEPVGYIYEDDEGRIMFSQMPTSAFFWEPVYRGKHKGKL